MVLLMLLSQETFCHFTFTSVSFYFMDPCFQFNAKQVDILHCLLHIFVFILCQHLCSLSFLFLFMDLSDLCSQENVTPAMLFDSKQNELYLLLPSVNEDSSCIFVLCSVSATAFFTVVGLMVSHGIVEYFC